MVKKKRKLKRKAKYICFFLFLFVCILLGFFLLPIHKRGKKQEQGIDKFTYVYQESVFPTFVVDVPVHTDLILEHTSARPSTKRIIKKVQDHGIMLHI